jgi:hypothetical protein
VTTDETDARRHPTDAGLIRLLDGQRMQTVDALFDEFRTAFGFPAYFGENSPAFSEYLRDLTWLPTPSYRVVITMASSLLSRDEGDRPTFLRIMRETGRAWAHKLGLGPEWGSEDVPFSTVLVGAPSSWPIVQ